MNDRSSRLVFFLVGAAAFFVILFGIRGTASVLNPIFMALVITVTVLPVPGWLNKKGLPGWLSLVVTIGLVVLVLALVITTVFFSVTKLATEVPTYTASASEQTTANSSEAGSAEEAASTTLNAETGTVLQGFVTSMLNLLIQFIVALFIFFFMISAAISLPGASRLGIDPNAPVLRRIATLTQGIRKYMTVLTGVNFLVGLGDTVFLLYLGVDYAVLWGLLAWFMGYIPSVGFIIALIPPMIMAYAQYGLSTALVVLIGYILINGGVQNFIQPKVMGNNLKISPVVVFVGLFIWSFLLGGIGAILAVPLTLLTLLIMENFEGTRTIAVLMRYTGEEKKEERQEAAKRIESLWSKVRGTFGSDHESEPRDK